MSSTTANKDPTSGVLKTGLEPAIILDLIDQSVTLYNLN